MSDRIKEEVRLLRRRFPDLLYENNADWFLVPEYGLPPGWNRAGTDVVFQAPVGYPGTHPYGIYVRCGLLFNGKPPDNFTEIAPSQPPFEGTWSILSWSPEDGEWRPTADVAAGSNLLNWVLGFRHRFEGGV